MIEGLDRLLDRLAHERLMGRLERASTAARDLWLHDVRHRLGVDGVGVSGGDPVANFGKSTIQAGSTIIGSAAAGVTIIVATGDGAAYPTGAAFNVVAWPANPGERRALLATLSRKQPQWFAEIANAAAENAGITDDERLD